MSGIGHSDDHPHPSRLGADTNRHIHALVTANRMMDQRIREQLRRHRDAHIHAMCVHLGARQVRRHVTTRQST
jgi:hypothetical protein